MYIRPFWSLKPALCAFPGPEEPTSAGGIQQEGHDESLRSAPRSRWTPVWSVGPNPGTRYCRINERDGVWLSFSCVSSFWKSNRFAPFDSRACVDANSTRTAVPENEEEIVHTHCRKPFGNQTVYGSFLGAGFGRPWPGGI